MNTHQIAQKRRRVNQPLERSKGGSSGPSGRFGWSLFRRPQCRCLDPYLAPSPPRRVGWLCGSVCQTPSVAFAGSSDHLAGSIVSPSSFGWSRDAFRALAFFFVSVPGSRKARAFLVTYLVLLNSRTQLCDQLVAGRQSTASLPLERHAELVWCTCRAWTRALRSLQRSRP
jgi:hypothetical protein